MNIVALHYKVSFYLDAEKSPRFKIKSFDKAINSAINDIVLDRYNNIRQRQKEYAFQTSQRLRDELYTIVKEASGLTHTNDIISVSGITDYWLLLALEANVSGKTINTIPLTYDEKNIIELDPFVRPSINYPERVYRIESSEGIKIIYGEVGTLLSGHAYYIKKPVKVFMGTEISDTDTVMRAGDEVIAYIDTVLNIYNNGVLIGTEELLEEEEYTVPVSGNYEAKINTGIVFVNPIDTDLPDMLHEEIARKAASILSGNVENYNREKSLESNIENTQN